MASVDFKLDDVELKANIAQLGPKINKAITLTTDFGAARGEDQMKLKAPWTDRTGAARAGLHKNVDHSGTSAIGFKRHTITFAHGVDYGIWLEVANSGKYQIIMPTVLAVGKEVMKALDGSLGKLDVPPAFSVLVDLPGLRQGTSQGATVHAGRQARRAKRTVKGQSSNTTKRTRRT